MNAAEVHLTLNHLPVLIPPLGLALLIAGLYFRSSDLRIAGLCFLILAGIMAIPTYLSGEPGEAIVKNYPGVSRRAINEHEDAAFVALIALEVAAVGALLTFILILRRKLVPRLLWVLLLVLQSVACGLLARTAHYGGHIRHEEMQTPEERERFDDGMTSVFAPATDTRADA